jgi:phosphoketolase
MQMSLAYSRCEQHSPELGYYFIEIQNVLLTILSLENQRARRDVSQDALYFRRDRKDVTAALHDSYELIFSLRPGRLQGETLQVSGMCTNMANLNTICPSITEH